MCYSDKVSNEGKFSVLDESMIDILQSMMPKKTDSHSATVFEIHEDIGYLLKQCRRFLIQADYVHLEKKAIELANKAVLIGAKKMLKTIYELQGLARLQDITGATKSIECLELDWILVRDEIANLSK